MCREDTKLDFPYGRCECSNERCECSDKAGPAAYRVERDGEQIQVCTRCILPNDRVLRILVDLTADPGPFIKYDILGALVLQEDLRRAKEMN